MTKKTAITPAIEALLADPRYGILRLKPPNEGFIWRVKLTRDGKRYTSSFADNRLGGPEAAYAAARACRDALLVKLGPAGRTAPRWQPPAGYTTGVRGVRLTWDRGRAYLRAATKMPTGESLSQMFSIDKYGEAKAHRLAVAARKQQWQRREDYLAAHPPAPKKPAKRPQLPAALYGIHRVEDDSRSSPAWDVMIRRKNQLYNHSFSDSTHGGKAGALRAAKAFRDEVIRRVEPMLRVERQQMLTAANTSGVAGVIRQVLYGRKHGRNGYAVYHAKTRLSDGRTLSKSFGIPKYGEENARALAIAAREEQLKQVEGYWVHSPGALPVDVPQPSRRSTRHDKKQP